MTRIAIGDSIAVGTAQALACKSDARVGAPSDEVFRRMVSAKGHDEVVISVGSNDPTSPWLAPMIEAIRCRVDPGAKVAWIVPQHARAAGIVQERAKAAGDHVVAFSPAADRVHPKSYVTLANKVREVFTGAAPAASSTPDPLKPFFDTVRKSLHLGTITQSQVDGWKSLLAAVPADFPVEWTAYCLATAYHETAATMQPIEEYGRGAGKAYGAADPATGQRYFGRGYVQLTWKANYAKATEKLHARGHTGVDFVNRPAEVMRPDYAALILFIGMKEGWFTGKKLGHYFGDGKNDPVNARRIVNGTDKAAKIARDHAVCLAALKAISFVPASRTA